MSIHLKIILGIILLAQLASLSCLAQDSAVLLNLSFSNQQFSEFVRKVESKKGVHIYFNPDSIAGLPMIIKGDSVPLLSVLKNNLGKTGMYITRDHEGNYYITAGGPVRTSLTSDDYLWIGEDTTIEKKPRETAKFIETKSEYIPETLVIGSATTKRFSEKIRFTGKVVDKKSGEPVPGATVYIEELRQGTASGGNGHFTLSLPRGEYTMQVSSIDKVPHKYNLILYSNGEATLTLKSKLVALEEVTVSSDKFNKVRSTQMGLEHISAKDAKNIPVVMGERDVLKVVQLLPGVQKAGEGASGFNVRGSPADQNLFYLNNIPVYNVNHLNGFFSAFHPEAISEVNLYKSNIPVEYGGRLASVFDISTKKGSMKKFGLHGGVSPISANLLIDNPIVKDKGSFMLGARSSYINWLLKRVKDPQIRNSDAYFGDMLGSVNYDVTENDQISFFGYYSNDQMNFDHKVEHSYSNKGASLSWDHVIKKRHNFNSALVFSRYEFEETNHEVAYNPFRHNYYIEQYEWKNTLTLYPGENHTMVAGFDNTYYNQSRGNHYFLQNDSVVKTLKLGNEQALETGIYLSDEWKLSKHFSVYAGVRYNIYNYLGPQDIYHYASYDLRKININDTLHYGRNKVIKTYQKPDVRMSLKYQILPNFSIKAGYNQLQQNIFMLSNTLSISPTDKWKLADYHIKPMSGIQYSFGLYYNTPQRKYELSAETYYKKVNNFVEYKDGADLLIAEIPETEVLQGTLTAYGAEFMIRKNSGNFTGWLNYSFTHTEVLINSENPLNQVNNGIPFPSNYDKPNSVNLVTNYSFSHRFSMSCNAVYSTGRPFTSPVSVYYLQTNPVINYSARNELRIPDYFRIDLSANLEGNLVKRKLAHGSWMFSVYNLLGRKNAYSVYFTSEEGKVSGYKLSIFGAPIYTVTYIVKLGNYND
ncbi:MAG TPA: TonB-dependent receptor [Bacteroidales bacterium]|nr:TonB-dependent receptor [Bacteroidales bacterium]